MKLIVLLLWIIILIFLEKIVRKKLNIPRQTGWNSKYVSQSHKWGHWIIIISYVVLMMIVSILNPIYMTYIPIFFFITLYIFQGYMQWKYNRQTKEYIISFGVVPLLIITGIILNVFYNTYW
ncbi:DUF4181 domain-containing protein [Bacillus mycoides]|uniref:DUF4181 domain-containing protein n=1 Tax=Bacillus TaxID=1386 RepID=UPI000DC2827A|nr:MULTISPECIES: DUF4181 domain-containing protein [Bacillus]MBJ7957362.1 DUF4181 domain-containing protein [Bacillus cereus group sp. N28]MDI6533913.1 DUF4181 domain-containing protein [Bacillus mycoides]MED1058417.1 DUF4181 domain-containing protein [Bacillus mycoides]RAN68071.1 capsular biosynthesis protein CpsH [Bacillus sp. SRB_8]WJE56025.1 DUF4181 domain-containing protein [Bacillus mycoides]